MGDHRVDDGRGPQLIDSQVEVSQGVEGKTAVVAGLKTVFILQEGAYGFASAAAEEDGIERNVEVDEAGSEVREEQGTGAFIFDGTAAEGEDELVTRGKRADRVMFELAKPGFAAFGKDAGDGGACCGFNGSVCVDEAPAELACEKAAYRAFSGAHESGEDEPPGEGRGLGPGRQLRSV